MSKNAMNPDGFYHGKLYDSDFDKIANREERLEQAADKIINEYIINNLAALNMALYADLKYQIVEIIKENLDDG